MSASLSTTDSLILAGGCFWCLEAIFKRLQGVTTVTPGYTGGKLENPSYEAVCSGNTGHAEAVKIVFDPHVISLETLLEVFWKLHDPTTLNRQGADSGTQYRSAIFYANDQQKNSALVSKQGLENSHIYPNPVITEITKLETFYPAENYHNNYYDNNRNQGYCRLVIDPKIQKLYKDFAHNLKKE